VSDTVVAASRRRRGRRPVDWCPRVARPSIAQGTVTAALASRGARHLALVFQLNNALTD
jgi:hypothetical protein